MKLCSKSTWIIVSHPEFNDLKISYVENEKGIQHANTLYLLSMGNKNRRFFILALKK